MLLFVAFHCYPALFVFCGEYVSRGQTDPEQKGLRKRISLICGRLMLHQAD